MSIRTAVTASGVRDLVSWTSLARDVEAMGFDVLLLPETVRTGAPLPALAAAAAATTALHVGTWVQCTPLRTAGTTAWEAATMRRLLGDRFELGLGAGRPESESDAETLGMPYGPAAERVDHLEQTIARIRRDLPGQRLLVAASGPRMLRLAARTADTVALALPPDADRSAVAEVVASIRAAASEPPELATGLIAVGDTAAPWLAHLGLDPTQLAQQDALSVLAGDSTQMADELVRRRDELGIGYVTVPEESARTFAEVIPLLDAR